MQIKLHISLLYAWFNRIKITCLWQCACADYRKSPGSRFPKKERKIERERKEKERNKEKNKEIMKRKNCVAESWLLRNIM